MAENSNIEWTDHTFNPWRGCTKVSPACDHCYAETMSKRNPSVLGVWGKYGTRVIAAESYWKQPLKWNREAEAQGQRKRVFCASLADVFEGDETMPHTARAEVFKARIRLFALIQTTPFLDWLLLTKRPELVTPTLQDLGIYGTLSKVMPNVWIGTTVENQKYADLRIPELLKIPAKVRFLSVEPMLGPIDLRLPTQRFTRSDGSLGCSHCCNGDRCDNAQHYDRSSCPYCRGTGEGKPIGWVICGGESGGSQSRPMDPMWVRSLRDQCQDASVPFLFKQWGDWVDEFHPAADSQKHEIDGRFTIPIDDGSDYYGLYMMRVGKRAAGRELDGRTWDQIPEVANA